QARGVALPPIARRDEPDGLAYRHVRVEIDREQRTASFTIVAPTGEQPGDVAGIEAAGADWWPLAMGRELDDAILCMRTNETEIGTWLLRTEGSPAAVLAADRLLAEHREHWFVRETIGLLRRTLARLDVSSRSMFALVEPGSCFAGLLAELAFAADRGYMLALPDEPERAPGLVLTESSFGLFPMVNGQSRLARRFHDDAAVLEALRARIGEAFDAERAEAAGLVTFAPDALDLDDEIRITLEERAALSAVALTGLESNLRFTTETMETRIFGRLSAWQNWIFTRPNAVGEAGALKVYGTGEKARLDRHRA